MRLISFSCKELSSFITREIEFFPDVTFLHGINGSGKTTILRAIASLLTPDPLWLSNATFQSLEVRLEHDNHEITITALKGEANAITIKISEPISLEDTVKVDDLRLAAKTSEEEYYGTRIDPDEVTHRIRSFMESVPVLAYLQTMPSPIFLGLDRTTLTPSITRAHRVATRGRTVHPYFRTQLDDAILEAERLLARQLSLLSNERNKIFEDLRNQFVLSLFSVPRVEEGFDVNKLDQLTNNFDTMRSSALYALTRININPTAITSIVEPFFKEINVIAQNARAAQKEYLKSKDGSKAISAYIQGINPLMNLMPSISIINRTLEKVEVANKNEKLLSRPLETYQRIMDTFFGDSGKALVFEENVVRVRLPSGEVGDLTSLSSGERQIFVLITHLIFNPAIRRENVLLIDEPELSLHLKWQRQFVTAIREASPSTQMILATHSPEIIFDRDDRLVELVI
jgi:predicted ATPase